MKRLIQLVLLGVASRLNKAAVILQNENVLEYIGSVRAIDETKEKIKKEIKKEIEFERYHKRIRKAWLKPL